MEKTHPRIISFSFFFSSFSSSTLLPFLFLLLLILEAGNGVAAGQRRIHISDDLDDVIDDEEDEAWKQWGKKSKPAEDDFEPPPFDLYESDPSAFQAEMIKRHTGPSMGFVKLQPGIPRSKDMVAEIAMKWTKVLKTGSINARFMGFDLNTVMFTMENGQDVTEFNEFVLSQPEAYEIKIGDQIFRRPGDPSLEEVVKKLQDKHKADDQSSKEELGHLKDEL